MNRRTVLISTGVALSALLGGCLDNSVFGQEGLPANQHGHCQATMYVDVYPATNISDDEDVYDAEADGFTDVETIATALEAAAAEYEARKAANSNDTSIESDDSLARVNTTTENNKVRNLLMYRQFVEYEGRTYRIVWGEVQC